MSECLSSAVLCSFAEPIAEYARMALVDLRLVLYRWGIDGWSVAAVGWGVAAVLYLRLRYARLPRRPGAVRLPAEPPPTARDEHESTPG